MRTNETAVYYLDMTAEEIYEHYEQMTLKEAYQKKKVSLKEIFASWWFYILTNALCFLACGATIIVAGFVLVDCLASTQITLSILDATRQWPLVFVGTGIVLLAVLMHFITTSMMRKECILVEKGEALYV